jgi:hypothetical protein
MEFVFKTDFQNILQYYQQEDFVYELITLLSSSLSPIELSLTTDYRLCVYLSSISSSATEAQMDQGDLIAGLQ